MVQSKKHLKQIQESIERSEVPWASPKNDIIIVYIYIFKIPTEIFGWLNQKETIPGVYTPSTWRIIPLDVSVSG